MLLCCASAGHSKSKLGPIGNYSVPVGRTLLSVSTTKKKSGRRPKSGKRRDCVLKIFEVKTKWGHLPLQSIARSGEELAK